MKHQKYIEMMELALLQELNDAELEELHKHLIECDDCQFEYDKLNDFYKAIDKLDKRETDEFSLQNARRDLRLALDKEISKRSFFEKITEGVKNFSFYNYKPLIAALLLWLWGYLWDMYSFILEPVIILTQQHR